MKAKFEYFKGKDNQWYFNLRSNNGKIIAQSEGYKTKTNALGGIKSIKRVAKDATVVELLRF